MPWSAQPPHKAPPVDCVSISGFYLTLHYNPSKEKAEASPLLWVADQTFALS